ncbi:FHA domain-containing protein [Streptomyces litchfieldiae]|uniref:FHA domain-containing protein n=1 Tax=Streptomyces litchfieldiae TaxID=3075543 RepID=A0ABU2MUG2_9ACTN|nr:FHA domain-containing protein [Streptomyces sp. DSM 44938]MDT0344953.1 FHA domain-containing protein [Streptomyces sp. DSM 44938]
MRVYVLDGDQYTVGRAAPNHEPDIVLAPDPQGWISRLHCILDLEHGQWWVTDQARNGTLLLRDIPGSEMRPLRGRELLKHGDTLLVLGDMVDDEQLLYWRLTYVDAHATRPAPRRPEASGSGASRPSIRYDPVGSRVYRVEGDKETLVEGLRPKGHQLLRHMVSRSSGLSGAEAVACDHDELITALWRTREEWLPGRSYDRTDLAGVVRAVRRCIEPDPANPRILETVPTIGYRLYLYLAAPPGYWGQVRK